MFSGADIVGMLTEAGITHVVWVPDSTLGKWESDLRASREIRLVTVCREGEAWAVAAGLYLGGARPLVMIQCTGLFESGDSMRNVLHDFRMPLPSLIGYRSYLNESTLPGDTAKVYTEPILKAWNLDYRLILEASQRDEIVSLWRGCEASGRPSVVLLAEGRA
jgi:sulfopyruvate decarboxylase TPP-binding subunit